MKLYNSDSNIETFTWSHAGEAIVIATPIAKGEGAIAYIDGVETFLRYEILDVLDGTLYYAQDDYSARIIGNALAVNISSVLNAQEA